MNKRDNDKISNNQPCRMTHCYNAFLSGGNNLKNMGWNVTSHEGKTCYERDGMRVFRTQDIEAIERQERIEAEQRNNNVCWDYNEEEWESPESDLTTTQTLIIFGMLIASILYLIFGAG